MSKSIIEKKLYRKVEVLLILTRSFSKEEKRLLICLGYKMSMADDFMDIAEKQYLKIVGKKLQIEDKDLDTLESIFASQKITESRKIIWIQKFLNAEKLNSIKLISKAANHCLEYILSKSKIPEKQNTGIELFKKQHKQLEERSYELFQLLYEGFNLSIIPEYLLEEIRQIGNKVKAQRLRVAVIGEFSQGKSTLLNAWLGEEIQPVRATPCSGTITILKHGDRKRVICYYKDGGKEEVSFDEYQAKASIVEDIAIDGKLEECYQSEIKEIVLEHPELMLCKNGVEIVDSPGLNEHPDRSLMTQKLIDNTDAIIFLTNASRLLTQRERELLEDLRVRINNGDETKPVNNIFVVVNFMDLIRREKDRQGVEKRVNNIVCGDNPIIAGENRIHFISAQSAVDALLEDSDSDYLKSFQSFTQSVESFLINECGVLKINQIQRLINNLIDSCLSEFDQFEKLVTGKLQISEQNKQQIFDCIGEITGRDVKFKLMYDNVAETLDEKIPVIWDEWIGEDGQGLFERLQKKSEHWTSENNDDQEKKIKDYGKQFSQDFIEDFTENFEKKVLSQIFNDCIELLDHETKDTLESIKRSLQSLDSEIGSQLTKQFNTSLSKLQDDMNFKLLVSKDNDNKWLKIGGGLIVGVLGVFTGGILSLIFGGLAGSFLGSLFSDPKDTVLEKGFEKIGESIDEIYEQFCDKVISILREKLETYSQITKQSIVICEQLIEQYEIIHTKVLKSNEAALHWTNSKRQDLDKFSVAK